MSWNLLRSLADFPDSLSTYRSRMESLVVRDICSSEETTETFDLMFSYWENHWCGQPYGGKVEVSCSVDDGGLCWSWYIDGREMDARAFRFVRFWDHVGVEFYFGALGSERWHDSGVFPLVLDGTVERLSFIASETHVNIQDLPFSRRIWGDGGFEAVKRLLGALKRFRDPELWLVDEHCHTIDGDGIPEWGELALGLGVQLHLAIGTCNYDGFIY